MTVQAGAGGSGVFISPIFRDVFVFTVKRLYVGELEPKGKSVLKLMAAALRLL